MRKQYDAIWLNAQLATCEKGYGLIQEAGIAVKDGVIAWVGPVSELTADPEDLAETIHDCDGCCLTPGLIDCHTHLVFAGNRAHEFEMRLQGATYEEIARQGGGIQSTVNATRSVSEDALFKQSVRRARDLQRSGVTTIEIKSGYGLDWATERKMLRIAKRIEDALPLTVSKTFLGAHTFPAEYRNDQETYVEMICKEMIPQVAKDRLAEAVDVFCEKIAFNLDQTRRVFATAAEHGLKVKCHAEQLSDMGASELAASFRPLSVDHLEHVSTVGVKAIERSGTVAVLLPGAFYFLRETKLPPVDMLRRHHIPIAIASDCNPGTSPMLSLLMVMNMACTLFRLTPSEALEAVTRHAASALGMSSQRGTLTVGKAADIAVWEVNHPAELAYYMGGSPLRQLIKEGQTVF